MKMWTFILAGLLLVFLGSALEDAGVIVNGTYSQGKFELRVWPNGTRAACTQIHQHTLDWFRISQWERIIQDFAGGMNNMNATLSLGTPSLQIVIVTPNVSGTYASCTYLTTANKIATASSSLVTINSYMSRAAYYAVKVNNTEHATMRRGFNYVKNLVLNRFQNKSRMNPLFMAVETAASGQAYVGVMKDFHL